MKKDHLEYDYLYVSVKMGRLIKILDCYRNLGWEVVKSEDDRKYFDRRYFTLRRPHRYPNKDRLQYLQVRIETIFNAISRCHTFRHSKSGAIATVFATLGFLFLAVGLYLLFSLSNVGLDVLTYSILGASGAFLLIALVPIIALSKKENTSAQNDIDGKIKEIETLVEEAKLLLPSQDDSEVLTLEVIAEGD